MRTRETKVYQFDELSDHAKEKARDGYRRAISDSFDYFDSGGIIEDAANMATLFGLDIRVKRTKLMNGQYRLDPEVYYSGFSSQGSGASYSGSYSYRKGSVAAVAKEAPTGTGKRYEGNNELNCIVRKLYDVQRRNFYQLQASIDGRSHRGFSLDIDVERADEKPMILDAEETISRCLEDFADYIYRQLEREYEYRQSDEVVDENIVANEYEFDVDGNRE